MARHNSTSFPNVQTWGQLLPADLLRRVLLFDKEMEGLEPKDYHLVGEKLNEAINRSWQKMLSVWHEFAACRDRLASTETGTSQTREFLLLPLFQELGYGRLAGAKPEEREVELPDGSRQSYPISHFGYESPIHLVGCKVSLDTKSAGVMGAARQSPHSLVQEFLNRSDAHLWGFVSNGLTLRILRDNASLSRQAYVEFNLEGIFQEESYSEFALMWLCCHQSRVHTEGEAPENCWLERWYKDAGKASVAALESLRGNVTNAIEILGQGFIGANPELRQKLANGTLDKQDYFRQLLRLAYRLIFLFVVEERGILHDPQASTVARERYDQYWSLHRLRDLARQTPGSRHHDLWEGVKFVMGALRGPDKCEFLGLAPMGSFLWSDEALPDIAELKLSNSSLLEAIRALAFTVTAAWEKRPVDWRHLGAQELGSIYESLLEMQPKIGEGTFKLGSAAGNDRKTTGSYYTPAPLIESLLETALDPVIDDAVKSENPEAALLDLKVCDPACGSGHFLLAAANRIAKRLAVLRTGDAEPTIPALQEALRDVVSRCIYGVDINPMSVELCRVGLWLETHEPGKPLSFLEHHIMCGNSLMGTTADAIKKDFPENTYAALRGDDKKAAVQLKKNNDARRKEKQLRLFHDVEEMKYTAVFDAVEPHKLEAMPENTLKEVEAKKQAWQNKQADEAWQRKKTFYDMWTAAFVLPRQFYTGAGKVIQALGVTWNTLTRFADRQDPPQELSEAIKKAAAEYQFFHFEVMFPEVERKGGFDIVLGNPPWERIKIQEEEWFAAHNRPDIAKSRNKAERDKKIAMLKDPREGDPVLFQKWEKELVKTEKYSHFLRNSDIFPLCGRGDINLYSVFAEKMRSILNENGRLGCIVPTGIATDDSTKLFFQNLIESQSLYSLYDFENKGIFPGVHSSYKFSLLTVGSGQNHHAKKAKFVFFAHGLEDIGEKEKMFSLTREDFALLNPNTRTCPVFRSTKDAELTRAVYRRVPVLLKQGQGKTPDENPWGIRLGSMFHMSNDSRLFMTKEQLERMGCQLQGNIYELDEKTYLPLYEAKMVHHCNHRFATFHINSKGKLDTTESTLSQLKDKNYCVQPRYWVEKENIYKKTANFYIKYKWYLGLRNITNTTNERTFISSIFPFSGAGHSIPLIFINKNNILKFYSIIITFIVDYIARQKIGGTNFTFNYLYQVPILKSDTFSLTCSWCQTETVESWLRPRILELVYTSEDMRPFAEDMGYDGDPLDWDEDRRALLRSEIDAAMFHLYLPANLDGTWKKCDTETDADYDALVSCFPTPRDAVDYIMDTFPIVEKNDMKKFNRYKTKEDILSKYDEFFEKSRQSQAS